MASSSLRTYLSLLLPQYRERGASVRRSCRNGRVVCTDHCYILVPKEGVAPEMLYVACATIRQEVWRFSYGAQITPRRIAWFPLPVGPEVIAAVRAQLEPATRIEKLALEEAADEADQRIARQRLKELADDPEKAVSGKKLKSKLDELLS